VAAVILPPVEQGDAMPRGVYDRSKAKPRPKQNGADTDDVKRGDPAQHVLGKPEEQSARVHAELPPRQTLPTAKTILADVKMRRQELEPLVEEARVLEKALKALEGI
jgi:hypothetical protein